VALQEGPPGFGRPDTRNVPRRILGDAAISMPANPRVARAEGHSARGRGCCSQERSRADRRPILVVVNGYPRRAGLGAEAWPFSGPERSPWRPVRAERDRLKEHVVRADRRFPRRCCVRSGIRVSAKVARSHRDTRSDRNSRYAMTRLLRITGHAAYSLNGGRSSQIGVQSSPHSSRYISGLATEPFARPPTQGSYSGSAHWLKNAETRPFS
jgi:hypothetical protein